MNLGSVMHSSLIVLQLLPPIYSSFLQFTGYLDFLFSIFLAPVVSGISFSSLFISIDCSSFWCLINVLDERMFHEIFSFHGLHLGAFMNWVFETPCNGLGRLAEI